MANDLLIAAIRAADLDLDEIADLAEVDRRTVQRWLGGRVPHPRYRRKLAAALRTSETELWPDATAIRRVSDLEEIAGAWARRDAAEALDPRARLAQASRQIDLLGYSLSTLLEPRTVTALSARASDRCQVRIALIDPDSDVAHAADLALRPSGRLIARVRASLERLAPVLGQPGVQIRTHQVATSHTILRFDDELLATLHLHGTAGRDAPLLHVRRRRDYGIFDQLTKHLEDVWDTARPLALPEDQQGPDVPPRDEFLDSLDQVWRPQ